MPLRASRGLWTQLPQASILTVFSSIFFTALCGDVQSCASNHMTGQDSVEAALLQVGWQRDYTSSNQDVAPAAKPAAAPAVTPAAAPAPQVQPAAPEGSSVATGSPTTPAMDVFTWKLIRPDPWICDLMPGNDPRRRTCQLTPNNAEGLRPDLLSCGADDSCNIEHANSFRTLNLVGALPCCPTPPFCSAPMCKQPPIKSSAGVCTKWSAQENLAYLKRPDTWPAYHGFGGAYELDLHKMFDALACKDAAGCPADFTFDLAFDLGANTGYYTEKLTARNFAANYILVEANPATADVLRSRWHNDTWKQAWFTQQVPQKSGSKIPEFEIFNRALSSKTDGVLDMCYTEGSLANTAQGCNVSIYSLDSLAPGNLTSSFQQIFVQAKSAFVKVDTEGMDELVLRGMEKLLAETRGAYADGSPRHLVNFLQFEYSPMLSQSAKYREAFPEYNLKTATKFLESMGFETFLIGPRYLPLSHGSWDDDFVTFTMNPRNNLGSLLNYPNFDRRIASWCGRYVDCSNTDVPSITADIFAIRSNHPRAQELKLTLGACIESKDFDANDQQYTYS